MHESVKLVLEEVGVTEAARIIWVVLDEGLRQQLADIPRSYPGKVGPTVYDHHVTIITRVPTKWVQALEPLDGARIKVSIGNLYKSESIGAEAFEADITVEDPPEDYRNGEEIVLPPGKVKHVTHSLKWGVNPRHSNDALQSDDRELVSEHSIQGYGTLEIVRTS